MIFKPKTDVEYLVVSATCVFTITGVMGNVFGLIVLLRRHFRIQKNTGVYLAALLLMDVIFLATNPMFFRTVDVLFGVRVTTLNSGVCAGTLYLAAASHATSVWIIVLFSMEHLLAAAIGSKKLPTVFGTRTHGFLTLLVMCVMQAITYSYHLETYQVNADTGECTWSEHIKERGHVILTQLVHLINGSAIPLPVLATLSIIHVFLLHNVRELSCSIEITGRIDSDGKTSPRHFSIIAITIGVMTIVLPLPIAIFDGLSIAGLQTDSSPFIQPCLYGLLLLLHGTRFFLMCTSCSRVREEITEMLTCCPRKAKDELILAYSQTQSALHGPKKSEPLNVSCCGSGDSDYSEKPERPGE